MSHSRGPAPSRALAARPSSASGRRKRVCAVYTRTSTNERLDGAFSSLRAQDEACTAFIASQKLEGWVRSKTRYEDVACSAGSMRRCGLERLLDDVDAGAVQVIVVYKIDRLTRSLTDFAKIIALLEERGASVVAVTQAFDTHSPVGRLSLNILLSFAQFEREVTSERIRDKVAASKAKGIWSGGVVPLGYRVSAKKLVPHPTEAAVVRRIFERYDALRNIRKLLDELERDGIRSARRFERGNELLNRASVTKILTNRAYIGELVHKGNYRPGEHQGIVPRALFNSVQRHFHEEMLRREAQGFSALPWVLDDKVEDQFGRPMRPWSFTGGKQQYRYWLSELASGRSVDPARQRVAAVKLNAVVTDALCELLSDEQGLREILIPELRATAVGDTLAATALEIIRRIHKSSRRRIFDAMIGVVRLKQAHIEIVLDPVGVGRLFSLPAAHLAPLPELTAKPIYVRSCSEKLLARHQSERGERDEELVALLGEAHIAKRSAKENRHNRCDDLRVPHGPREEPNARLLGISKLAPELVVAILDGRQPAHLTASMLMSCDLPVDEAAQRLALRFGRATAAPAE